MQFERDVLSKFNILNQRRRVKTEDVDHSYLRNFEQMKKCFDPHTHDKDNLRILNKNKNSSRYNQKTKTSQNNNPWLVKTLPKSKKFNQLEEEFQIHSDPIPRKRLYEPKPSQSNRSSIKEIIEMNFIQSMHQRQLEFQANKEKVDTAKLQKKMAIVDVRDQFRKQKQHNKQQNFPTYHLHRQQQERMAHHLPQISEKTMVHPLQQCGKQKNGISRQKEKMVLPERCPGERTRHYLQRNNSVSYKVQNPIGTLNSKHQVSLRENPVKIRESNPELPIEEQVQIQARSNSPIQFSEYVKENQYAFVNRRLDDIKRLQHFHPRGYINTYNEALQRRKQNKSNRVQRGLKIKQMLKLEQKRYWNDQSIII